MGLSCRIGWVVYGVIHPYLFSEWGQRWSGFRNFMENAEEQVRS